MNPPKTNYSLYVVFSIFIVLSFGTASFWPDDQDGVNYLLGIDRYDLTFHQPHFPGYPVYIAFGKALTRLLGSPEIACVTLSVFFGVLCLWIVAFILEKNFNRRTSLICTTALAINPVFFEFSHKIFTEVPALFFLMAAIAMPGNPNEASPKRWLMSGIMLGLMLGIRLSWWPFALFYIVKSLRTGKLFYFFCGLLPGILFWLIPQAILIGPKELFLTGVSFTFGHFGQWGGAMGSELESDHRFIAFITRAGEALGWIGTGTLWSRFPWAIFSFFCFTMILKYNKNTNEQIRSFMGATLLYLAWLAIGQNPEKVRHLIPVIPVSILVMAPLIERYSKPAAAVVLVFALTLPLDYLGRTYDLPPAVRFRQWINSQSNSNAEFYCGNSERFFDRYFAKIPVISVPTIGKLSNKVDASWTEPATRFICDDIPGFKSAETPVVTFPARYGDPVDSTLHIYKLKLL